MTSVMHLLRWSPVSCSLEKHYRYSWYVFGLDGGKRANGELSRGGEPVHRS